MPDFPVRFLRALNESHAAYLAHGARSTAKLKPVHACIAAFVQESLGDAFDVKALGVADEKEQRIAGKYYNKMVDIAVLNARQEPVCAIAFKFVASNFGQNHINYFENMLGETANLRRGGCGVAQIIVLQYKTPYLNRAGDVARIEELKNHHLRKYIKLYEDRDYPHKPDLFHIVLVDIDDDGKVSYCKRSEIGLDDVLKDRLFDDLSIAAFARKFPALCVLKA